MTRLKDFLSNNPLAFLLLGLPLTLSAQVLGWSSVTVFILAAIGIIPLAAYIGEATEALAAHTNPRLGALLNATLGNAAELIITIAAVQAGLLELVKASITGSIIGNLMLVLGFAMVVGGIRHGVQHFNKQNAGRNAILLMLAVITLVIPSVFSQSISQTGNTNVEALSIGVAIIMIAGDVPADLPLVQMDAVLIERVLANLLENAVKYAGPDARIIVAARTAEDQLEVSVEDNGPGIPPGREEAIFEKFARGRAESATPGAGLGIAICRAIVRAQGGEIAIESEVGRGTSVHFTLPKARHLSEEAEAS